LQTARERAVAVTIAPDAGATPGCYTVTSTAAPPPTSRMDAVVAAFTAPPATTDAAAVAAATVATTTTRSGRTVRRRLNSDSYYDFDAADALLHEDGGGVE